MTEANAQKRSSAAVRGGPKRRGQLGFEFRTWGGKRKGAGRKPNGERAGVPHRARPEIGRRLPVHVTLRMARGVYNLRSRRSFRVITAALGTGADRFGMRVVKFSIQGNHIHLLVEAESHAALGRAMKGLSVRLAKGLNRMMGRTGQVLGDRYHAHVLRTPAEVKWAIHYIRDNARNHAAERGERYSSGYVDPYSSDCPDLDLVLPVAETWLLRVGWQRTP